MGFAIDHLPESQLEEIARGLFKVTGEDTQRGELIGHCPLHDDKTASFAYNYKKDVYNCSGCNTSNDIIDLWCQTQGHQTGKEGFKAFLKQFGIETAQENTKPTKKPTKKNTKKTLPPPPVIEEDIFQQMPKLPTNWVARLEETRGWSKETITELDLRLQTHYIDKNSGEVKEIHSKPQRIAMPVRDKNNEKLLNLRLYKPDAKAQKIISWGKGYGRSQLYPSPATLKPDLPIFLCEGEADTNCGRSQNLNTITQTSKLVTWPDDHKAPFKGRDVIICYDADQAGEKYAKHAAANLHKIAASVRLLTWPDYMGRLEDGTLPKKHGQDLTDFFVKHKKTIDDFQELVGQAKTYQPNAEEPPRQIYPSEFFEYNDATKRSTYKPRWLANRILQDIPLMFDPKTGVLYKWGGKYWEDYFEETVKKRCLQYLGDHSTTAKATDATAQAILLSTIAAGREVNDNGNLVCVNNGMLNLDELHTGKMNMTKHDKDYYCTYQLEVDYKPDSKKYCNRWIDFLHQTIQTEDPIKQIQEFTGYCLTRDTRFGKALFLLGPGSDGKSVYLKILRQLVGPQNCTAVSFQDMEDQFYRSALYNKLLNISTEVGSKAMESQYFKAIVTGDPIMASFKNKTPFEFIPCCKVAQAANKLPRILDNSDGLFRRLLPIKFKRQFFGKDIDTSLQENLEAELSEIFLWALAGLHRLWTQDGFTECDETKELLMGYKRLNNPVLCFVEESCELGATEEHTAQKKDIYKKYKNYCVRNGYSQLHNQNFFRELKSAVSSLKDFRPTINGKREYCVQGLRITDTTENNDE